MGSNRRKRTKQCSESDISDVNESTQPPTTSTKDTSSQHFPRFILVESKEENKPVTSLSPFVIQKVIQSIAGEPENIKKLHRSNQLLIEVSRKAHAENLLRAQTFHDLKVRVYPNTSLNSSKGVIRCPELGNCSEEEILEGTRSQGVTAIKRFKVKRNGELKNTNTFVFTFNTSVLPKTIKVAYFRVNVEVYIPNPLRCHHCQKYGHHEDRCSKDPICSKCGQVAEHPESQCRNELHCVNCGEKHSADSKECQVWHKEKEILRLKFTRNISFIEARKLVEAPTPIPGISYANITQSSMKKVSVVDTATQTDPINILDSAVQSSSTNTNSQTEDLQKQKGQTNTTNKNQTKTPSEEKKGDGGLKKATIEMIRKDWKKQQQKERQARSQSSPPTKETKSKSSQGTQRPSTSNRERKGSNNVIQQHNRFGSLSDSSDDMELGEAPDRPRTNRNRSRSSEHSHVNNSNNRSKSPITYP